MDDRRHSRKVGILDDEGMELKDQVISIRRVTKVVKGGKNLSFSALVAVGDERGRVGIGKGKAREVPQAIAKGVEAARKSMIRVPLAETTIPHLVKGVDGAGLVVLRPASKGTGVIAGGAVRVIMQLAGIRDILTKSIRSSNPISVANATLDALRRIRNPEDDGAQEVAPAGRLLELLLGGRPLHPALDRPGQLGQPALEEEAGVVDALAIVGFADAADAGSRAEPELVLEAGALAAAEDGVLAAADAEVPVDEMDGGAGPPGGAERPEIARAVGLDLAAEVDAGERLADRQLEVGEALVVLEPEVEAGLVLLDVVVLQEGGFLLGARQDEVDVGRLPEDAPDLDVGIGQEVGADAVAEGAGLADVDDLARGALEEVDAGLGRQAGRPRLEPFDVRHGPRLPALL